ncbi:serine O-acetyltransferase EpsC [Kiritimatiella glycovorans]|nr:serine O-acetyltransferase EpsC [Kiritimatiella glycovorans]
MQEIEQSIAHAAEDLAPLYAHGVEDRPDGVMASAPNTDQVIAAQELLITVMLPGRSFEAGRRGHVLSPFFAEKLRSASELLLPEIELALPFQWLGAAARSEGAERQTADRRRSAGIFEQFLQRLPDVRKLVVDDIRAAYNGDPAALSYAEVKLSYPGVLAITSHRLAHELYRLGVPVIPRIMSEHVHGHSGIDIHPGARIGRGFFIDHGTGVVIGETTEIGERVKLYQGVTLGAKSFPLDAEGHPVKHIKRHPTVEDEVVIYANATILGGETVIGARSIVGGNVFLVKSVPPDSLVTRRPGDLSVRTREGDERV